LLSSATRAREPPPCDVSKRPPRPPARDGHSHSGRERARPKRRRPKGGARRRAAARWLPKGGARVRGPGPKGGGQKEAAKRRRPKGGARGRAAAQWLPKGGALAAKRRACCCAHVRNLGTYGTTHRRKVDRYTRWEEEKKWKRTSVVRSLVQ
jgi:hypothetical protein